MNEAMKIYSALEPMIIKTISEQTQSCIRSKKMTVKAAAHNGVITVAEAYGSEIEIPYVTSIGSVRVGKSVIVIWFNNDFSTAIAAAYGNGQT